VVKSLAIAAAILTAAAAAGAGSAWFLTGSRGLYGERVTIGPWTTSLVIGAEAGDPWTRARIARTGLLALPRSEAVYFSANTDSSGEALRSTRRYRITGNMPPGVGLWSITAYGADDYLMNTPVALTSVSSVDVNGSNLALGLAPFDVVQPGPEAIVMTGDQRVTLVVRFYQHPDWDPQTIRGLELPRIEAMP